MYIQEIVVDGFKSYAHRTTIEGFDPHFNAITGLNGSGKSNILDSICFVLGITNLSHVRAGNLSELVYKQGQAGVTKATVTIIFNNQDAAQSPVGYEQCQEVTVSRQVLLGGKSKYWINGRVAPAGQVQNLFHSVQLNVNNPHFLIMQGRITKVLNMKPHEILGMLEEATGTRMYETKRVAALKTIDKKQQKVDELNNILAEEITPTLERLRSEKQSYLQWSKNNADLERLERLVVAYEFHRASKALDRNEEGFSGMNEELKGMEARSSDIQEEIDVIDAEIEERSLSLKGEHQEAFNKAKQMEDKRSKELVKVTSTWQNAKSELEKAETELIATRKLLTETRQGAESKQNEIDNAIDDTEETQQAAHSAEELLAQLTQQYQNISAGISSEEGDEGRTLPEQISKAHNDSKKAESRAQQAKMKIDHITKQLDSVKKDLHKQGKKVDDMDAERKVLIDKVDNLKSQIEHLDFSQETYDALEAEKLDIEPTISDMRTRLESLTAQLNERLSFDYTDPVRGFDRSKVKGLVAKLISVKDAKYATALEVAAGGRLYQVVVDEAITGKALLDRGQLERRVTIIPLDKIKSRQVSNNARSQAKQTADRMNTEAFSAIELVGFSEEVRNAVEYVFGAAIVVDGMKAANEICDLTKTRTVTLDGDVFDPTGTISGGSKNQLGATLAQLSEVAEIEQELAAKELRLRDVSKQITSLQVVSKKYDALSRNLTLAQAELEAKVKQMSYSSVGMLIEKRDTFQHELTEAEDELEAMSKEQETKWALYTQLTEHEVELTQKREEKISDIATAVKQAKADVQMKSQAAREVSSSIETLKLELQSLQGEVEAAEEAVRLAESVVEEYSTAETNLQIQVGEIKSLYDETKTELAVLEEKMSAYSSQLSALKSKKTELKKTSDEYAIKAKKLSMAINNALKERSSAEKMVANLLRKHSWIESERRAFGVSGGDYDFEAMDSNNFAKKLDTVRKEQETLAKSINKKVIGMIEKAEGEYTELQRKRKVVENDKKKIQDFIQELDVKKKTELEHTWVKVNKDFGSIFSTLLPGAFAKLEPPEGLEAWEGLEVKVAFGNVWKESLSELSGGQRSLLALSLILSLLLFKPAPMYILDEVDAALDLSHTQNIGHMLKTHFSQSQFLVVSLKENMFNNANVIFRTKFVDGVSTVSRTIGSGMNSGSSASKVLTNNNSTMGFTSKGSGKASQSRGRESQKGKENL